MSRRMYRFLCCTSTQKHSTWNTNWIRSEQFLQFDVEDLVGDVDDQSLSEELESCKHFLTDTEMENGRHRVFNFAMSSFDMSLLNDKLDYGFKELKCAAKVNLAFGFVLRNVED